MHVLARYNTAYTLYVPLIDKGATDFEQTPVTFATGAIKLIRDAATAVNETNSMSHEGLGIYSLALTAAEMQAANIVVTIIDQTSTKTWEDQCVILDTAFSGQIEANQSIIIGESTNATFTATTSAMEATRLSPNVSIEATADHMNGRLITWTSGALLGQQAEITDYVLANSKEKYTFSTVTEAVPASSRFVVT